MVGAVQLDKARSSYAVCRFPVADQSHYNKPEALIPVSVTAENELIKAYTIVGKI